MQALTASRPPFSLTAHAGGTPATYWRSLSTFAITRIVITVLLLLYLSYNPGREARALDAVVGWQVGALYLGLGIGFALLSIYRRRHFMLQLLAQVSVDVLAISLLYIEAGGLSTGLAILYLFPLAGSAILAPLVPALFAASVVTLVLLLESGYQILSSHGSGSTYQAGLYGAAFLAAVFVFNRLAARLIKQEALALRHGRDLHLQEAINRLVVADMSDGVLVVGPDTEVFAANAALERVVGMGIAHGEAGFKLGGIAALAPIADAFYRWRARSAESDSFPATAYVMIKPGEQRAARDPGSAAGPRHDLVVHLQLRFARVESEDLTGQAEDRTVIFVRDVTEIENQAQQLKLASMGRLTASIAHEVRNPLSAISHAASLLREDVREPTHARLLSIVAENVVRLDRMIEDILKLSRKAHVHDAPLRLTRVVQEIVEEFRENNALPPNLIAVGGLDAYSVRFDPLHLREVVVNLLSNASRYASGSPGSIRIRGFAPQPGRLELHVQDDGAPISPQVRAHLFEPFYTTSSKGTGLGLYVARELCLNNGAMLDYEYRTDPGHPGPTGRFVITFALERV